MKTATRAPDVHSIGMICMECRSKASKPVEDAGMGSESAGQESCLSSDK